MASKSRSKPKKKPEEDEEGMTPPELPELPELPGEDEELQEIENPYTVTNRAISELVRPRNTMLYLSDSQIRLILTAFEFARLPTNFGESVVKELEEFAWKLQYYLISKGGRGRRDILRVLRASSGQVHETVNKSLFKRLIEGGSEEEEEEG